jgi:hypothetical protein
MTYERYKVLNGSQSKHCCFEATVIDTNKPVMLRGEKMSWFHTVAECFELEDAMLICAALNAKEKKP